MTKLKTLLSIALLALLTGCAKHKADKQTETEALWQQIQTQQEWVLTGMTNSVIAVTNYPQGGIISWLNDGVYYLTNDWVYDEERNKTNQSNSSYYLKTVITTNRVPPNYYRMNDQLIEFGCRQDGTVVWRKVNNETNR